MRNDKNMKRMFFYGTPCILVFVYVDVYAQLIMACLVC